MIIELLKYTCSELEKNKIEYMLSGSVAMTLYATPRFTRDIDIVLNLKKKDITTFISIFSERFYINPKTVLEEVEKRGMFNIIDNESAYKIDFIIKKESDFRNKEFERKIQKSIYGFKAWVVSPEDLIISKLIWIQSFTSETQLQDLRMLLRDDKHLDKVYITEWSKKLKLLTFNLI